eukprot:EST41992.1 Hypothetical protein SS50377_18297 [Spironucleus salmonicida]
MAQLRNFFDLPESIQVFYFTFTHEIVSLQRKIDINLLLILNIVINAQFTAELITYHQIMTFIGPLTNISGLARQQSSAQTNQAPRTCHPPYFQIAQKSPKFTHQKSLLQRFLDGAVFVGILPQNRKIRPPISMLFTCAHTRPFAQSPALPRRLLAVQIQEGKILFLGICMMPLQVMKGQRRCL